MGYFFGDFHLDPKTGTLTGPDGVVPLRRQAFRLCEVLLEHAPDLMDRDQLLDAVWGRTALSPNVLPQTISELRHALGDSAQEPRYIETLHRRGYRVICPVTRAEAVRSPAEAGSAESAVVGATSLVPATPSRRSWLYAGALLTTAVVLLALWFYREAAQRESLYEETIPAIRSTVEADVFDAWRMTRQALEDAPEEPDLQQLLLDLSVPITLTSEPGGATVRVGPYDAGAGDWIDLGKTPLKEIRLPLSMLRFRVSKPGFTPLDVAPGVLPFAERFQLQPEGIAPEGMVYVPPGRVTYMGETRDLDGYWIQQHEVSNREYREFVEAGGYLRPEFWQHDIEIDGRLLSPEDISRSFIDSTGMPGPATWALGTYPEDQGDYPVEGISWFEAAAYAEFRGLQLPTVFHWWRAAGRGGPQEVQFGDVISAGNFQSRGAWPVGQGGLGPYGTRDMAGNVGEWCANPSGDARHFLGGSWQSAPYAFMDAFAQPALRRSEGYGVRLVSTDQPVHAGDLVPIQRAARAAVTPVSDTTFAIFARQYHYDESPLQAVVEDVDTAQRHWRRERISFDAAYGEDRVILNLFIPRDASPPLQTVVHFPGGDALLLDDSADAGLLSVEPFLRSGRAVAYPVYQGTFERKGRKRRGPLGVRRQLIEQAQDGSRTLDYLETREDIARDKIAFHGLSYGAVRAPFILAVEKRFATAMILSAGIPAADLPPEITMEHYLPRVTLPTLFMTGRDDFSYHYESSQLPFFQQLGTPPDQKKHVTFDGGHLPTGYSALQREVIAWLDRTLGEP
jgi:DNA-binding winged helix-turn-helix (wHTH) protein